MSYDTEVQRHEETRARVSVRRGKVLAGKHWGDILFEVQGAELSMTNGI